MIVYNGLVPKLLHCPVSDRKNQGGKILVLHFLNINNLQCAQSQGESLTGWYIYPIVVALMSICTVS